MVTLQRPVRYILILWLVSTGAVFSGIGSLRSVWVDACVVGA